MTIMHRFIKDQRGATSIEYCAIGAMVSILIITGCTLIGTNLHDLFLGPLANAMP